MKKTSRLVLSVMVGLWLVSSVYAQGKPQTQRRPAANAQAKPEKTRSSGSNDDGSSFILNGRPVLLSLHHDTEVGTNKPVDVYVEVIELQIMNSDGDLEPVGLQIFNYYTAKPQDPRNDINRHNAHDCKAWFRLQTKALENRDPKLKTWPYVEFVTSTDARVLQTNEDGAVWYSDDIECWGSSDRFSPF